MPSLAFKKNVVQCVLNSRAIFGVTSPSESIGAQDKMGWMIVAIFGSGIPFRTWWIAIASSEESGLWSFFVESHVVTVDKTGGIMGSNAGTGTGTGAESDAGDEARTGVGSGADVGTVTGVGTGAGEGIVGEDGE